MRQVWIQSLICLLRLQLAYLAPGVTLDQNMAKIQLEKISCFLLETRNPTLKVI